VVGADRDDLAGLDVRAERHGKIGESRERVPAHARESTQRPAA
jgi:hypothetical protein